MYVINTNSLNVFIFFYVVFRAELIIKRPFQNKQDEKKIRKHDLKYHTKYKKICRV